MSDSDAANEVGGDTAPQRRKSLGLGRGLSALLGEAVSAPAASDSPGVRSVALSDIAPHPDQPRRHFDTDALDELAASIAAHGILQPIVVRSVGANKFQIVAGERRWRAAQRAHLHEVPVIVREFDEGTTLEVALIENIQRADLNAIEEGEAYARLVRQFGHNQDALSKLVHKSRSHVANLMRLLDLPPVVRTAVADGHLSMGHARALLGTPGAEALAAEAIAQKWSVRDIERAAKRAKLPARIAHQTQDSPQRETDIAMLERQLGDLLGLKVGIAYKGKGGTVTLAYATLDQLDMICQRLSGEKI
jgi:ParB family transcriptional regulator, chromosome partitioning protein